MICQNCLRRLARRELLSSQRRLFSSSPSSRAQAVTAQQTTATNPRPHDTPAALSNPAVAQPISTPLTPTPSRQGKDASSTPNATPKVQSSVPAGTVLKGLNFVKNKTDPVALEDHEYPAWLWEVLQPRQKDGDAAGGGEKEGDLFSKSKKQRRLAAKSLRKQQLLNADAFAPKVPIYEQSIDLPRGDGTLQGAREAGQARQELTRAMRDKRRSTIKEANFLKEMR